MVDNHCQGSIISISSVSATTTASGGRGVGCAASKAAMNKWTENAALDLAEYGIRVNAIGPGVIESGINEHTVTTDPELWNYYLNKIPLKRTGTPSDIANMALFLASEEGSWITGKILKLMVVMRFDITNYSSWYMTEIPAKSVVVLSTIGLLAA